MGFINYSNIKIDKGNEDKIGVHYYEHFFNINYIFFVIYEN
jgi:hypothetical protein